MDAKVSRVKGCGNISILSGCMLDDATQPDNIEGAAGGDHEDELFLTSTTQQIGRQPQVSNPYQLDFVGEEETIEEFWSEMNKVIL